MNCFFKQNISTLAVTNLKQGLKSDQYEILEKDFSVQPSQKSSQTEPWIGTEGGKLPSGFHQ